MRDRMRQIDELLRQELGRLILQEMEFSDNSLVTITRVETSRDLRHAKILVSVLPITQAEAALGRLKSARLERLLKGRLTMKFVPRLNYQFDPSEHQAAKIERLLDQIT